jgi:hypothetical protein
MSNDEIYLNYHLTWHNKSIILIRKHVRGRRYLMETIMGYIHGRMRFRLLVLIDDVDEIGDML